MHRHIISALLYVAFCQLTQSFIGLHQLRYKVIYWHPYLEVQSGIMRTDQHASNLMSSNENVQDVAPSVSARTKGTIYITIGPQCSGKTTILRCIFGEPFQKIENTSSNNATIQADGIDITIDDQALVYIPIPVGHFMHDVARNGTSTEFTTGNITMNTEIFHKTIKQRIEDSSNDELRYVILRLGRKISAEQFTSRLIQNSGQHQQSELNIAVTNDLIAAVEDMVSTSNICLPEMVDLFIVESIFRPRPLHLIRNITREISYATECSALDAAHDLLKTHATKGQLHSAAAPIAWGNTNTRPREYTTALDAARQSGRPVKFIVFGGIEVCDMIRGYTSRGEDQKLQEDNIAQERVDNNVEVDQSQVLSLPKLSRLELMKRNLRRFSKTGRYMPSTAINDAMIRVESLLTSAAAEAKKTGDPNSTLTLDDAHFRLDYALAKLAGFELDGNRTVHAIANNGKRAIEMNRRNGQLSGSTIERGHHQRGRHYKNYKERRDHNNERGIGWNNYDGNRARGGHMGQSNANNSRTDSQRQQQYYRSSSQLDRGRYGGSNSSGYYGSYEDRRYH